MRVWQLITFFLWSKSIFVSANYCNKNLGDGSWRYNGGNQQVKVVATHQGWPLQFDPWLWCGRTWELIPINIPWHMHSHTQNNFFFNFRDNNIIVNRLILVNRNFFKNTCLPFLSSVGWCMFLIQLLGGRSRQVWVQPGLPTKFQGNQDYGEKLCHRQFPPTPLSKIIFYFL